MRSRRRFGRSCQGVFIATQLNSTELNSTSSFRYVHSVNNCHLSMNVVTQLTRFVGRYVMNKNTTDLAVRCSTGSVEFRWVELCRYKQPFKYSTRDENHTARASAYLQLVCKDGWSRAGLDLSRMARVCSIVLRCLTCEHPAAASCANANVSGKAERTQPRTAL